MRDHSSTPLEELQQSDVEPSIIEIDEYTSIPLSEIRWQFARSSGPGGQNVNKTSTSVELLFDLQSSPSLSDTQKECVCSRLGRLVDSEGVLHVESQVESSQWRNRERALERFAELLAYAVRPPRVRVRTRPSHAQKLRRLENKARLSEKKRRRAAPRTDDW